MSDIIDPITLGTLKSSTATVNTFQKMLTAALLSPDEAIIPEPTGFINIISSYIGETAGTSFFEQQMIKNEALPSTAILFSSLLRNLNSDEIGKFFANPATMTFVIGYKISQLIANGVAQINGQLNLRINKNAVITVGSLPSFTFDNDIVIVISNPTSPQFSIYAYLDEANGSTPFLSSRQISYDGDEYFVMYVNMRQYSRSVNTIQLSGSDFRQTHYLTYGDSLMGFDVEYMAPGATNFTKLVGLPEGLLNLTGYNYNITQLPASQGGGGQVAISFSRNPSALNPTSGYLRFTCYNTLGTKGNATLTNLQSAANSLAISMAQNKNDPPQAALNSMIAAVSVSTSQSKGGRDMMSIDELRSYIETRNRSGGKVISPGEIEQQAKSVGLNAYKTRSDVLGLVYNVSGQVVSSDGIVVPSIIKNIALNLGSNDGGITDNPLWKPNVGALVITPATIFSEPTTPISNAGNEVTVRTLDETKSSLELETEYIAEYSQGIKTNYCFPYLIRVIPSTTLDVEIYDTFVNQQYATDFIAFNNSSQNRASITGFTVTRDPTIQNHIEIFFDVNVGDSILDYEISRLDPRGQTVDQLTGTIIPSTALPSLVCKVLITLNNSLDQFVVVASVKLDADGYPIVDTKNNLIRFVAHLVVDDSITSNGDMLVYNDPYNQAIANVQSGSGIVPEPTSLGNIERFPYETPSSYYPIEPIVDVKIYTALLTVGGTATPVFSVGDVILKTNELNSGYYVSTIYEAKGVSLFSNITDVMQIDPDVSVTQPIVETYPTDVMARYSTDIFLKDANNNYVSQLVTKMLPNSSGVLVATPVATMVVQHAAGSVIYEDTPEAITLMAGMFRVPISAATTRLPNLTFASSDPAIVSVNSSGFATTHAVGAAVLSVFNGSTTPLVSFLVTVISSGSVFQPLVTMPTFAHRANDIVYAPNSTSALNPNGTPIILTPSKVTLILRSVPFYDRIFSFDHYNDIITGYQSLITQVSAISAIVPDGVSLTTGVLQTMGQGSWRLRSTGALMDNLALSFNLGYKVVSTAYNIDTTFVSNQIVQAIVTYVNNFTDYEFSVMKMLSDIQNQIPSIDYFEFYDLNEYGISYPGSDNAQTIYVPVASIKSTFNERLCVHYTAVLNTTPNPVTGLIPNTITFAPDIKIKIIN